MELKDNNISYFITTEDVMIILNGIERYLSMLTYWYPRFAGIILNGIERSGSSNAISSAYALDNP